MKYINLNFNSKISENYQELQYKLKYFLCGEFEFSIEEDISNQEITIFQSFTVGKFSDDLMKLQIVCDVLKRNNVKKITYFSPFLPYTRQDRTYDTQSSFGSKVVAEIIHNCGINEIITYDLHTFQIDNFFTIKVQNLSMIPKFIEDIKQKFISDEIIIVFPDAGATLRSKKFFANEKFKIAIINKNRVKIKENINEKENKKEQIQMQILNEVKNKIAIIIDDMIDSGETIIEALNVLLENKAKSVFVYATHGIFSGNAMKKIEQSKIEKIVVSESIFNTKNYRIIETFQIHYE